MVIFNSYVKLPEGILFLYIDDHLYIGCPIQDRRTLHNDVSLAHWI